jgi:hypothetical protein
MSTPLLAATIAAALATTAAAAPQFGQLERTNTGELRPNLFTGHVLTPDNPSEGGITGTTVRILCAPSEADDAGHRAAIQAAVQAATGAGTVVVDYFDTRSSTPSTGLLRTYDCVYTWANFAYSNNVLFGDNLAAVNNAPTGVDIVLGAFCTYTSGNFLSGAIMTPAYCPVVSPLGNNHFSNSTYQGDGVTCLYTTMVNPVQCTFRDFLTLQGTGVLDGTYLDGEICGAYRGTNPPGSGNVVYTNGSGWNALGCAGDWAQFTTQACVCGVAGVPASCVTRNGSGVNPVVYSCVAPPIAGQPWQTTITWDGSTITSVAVAGTAPTSGLFLDPSNEGLILGPYVTFPTTNGAGAHDFALVPLPLKGKTFFFQGLRVQAPGVLNLTNALDVTIG